MPSLEPLFPYLFPYLLVVARLAGLFMFAPLMSSLAVPMKVKGLLVLALSAAIFPAVPAAFKQTPVMDLFTLLPLVLSESMIGFVVGLIASAPIMAMQAAGVVTSQQLGFGLGQTYNPTLESESDAIGQLFSYLGLSTFLAVGGIEGSFIAVLNTFKLVPVGSFTTSMIPSELIIGSLSGGLELAVRMSAPVMAIIALLLVVFGFLSRTMPALNVMTVGFTVKIVAAIAILIVSMRATGMAVGEETAAVLRELLVWSRGGH